jgi:hypothetical protein
MLNGVEILLDLVGVVTRASDKKYLPRFFRVIIQKDIQHGHTKPPYRATH